jgi:acyl-CoA synthetase (AMP-forming)/AMP-acid ligase II
MMNNHLEVVVAFFAIVRLGAIAVSTNVMLKLDELRYLLEDSGAAAIVCEASVADVVAQAQSEVSSLEHVVVLGEARGDMVAFSDLEVATDIPPPADCFPDETAFITYTSGTTGNPKGVMMSHFWLDFVTLGWVNVMKLTRDDRVLVASPFFYIIGSVVETLTAFRIGAAAVFFERFKPRLALDAITKHRPTATVLVPTAVVQLLDNFDPERDSVGDMRALFTSGAPCSASVKERLRNEFGWQPREMYGLSEAHMLADGSVGLPLKDGFVGVPAANMEVRVVDDAGNEVPRGTVGEFVCRGDAVTTGYWGKPKETEETYGGGWLKTGDLGLMDEDGYIKVVDRKKEMIITGGANIYPAEVERVLGQHPDVSLVALLGKPDVEYGEVPCAFVVPREGAKPSEQDIIEFCRTRMAVYKCPRHVKVVDSLPLTASGKVARQQLRDLLRFARTPA